MRRDKSSSRARTPRFTRRRLLLSGAVAAAALTLIASCGDQEVEHGKFKLRSHINW